MEWPSGPCSARYFLVGEGSTIGRLASPAAVFRCRLFVEGTRAATQSQLRKLVLGESMVAPVADRLADRERRRNHRASTFCFRSSDELPRISKREFWNEAPANDRLAIEVIVSSLPGAPP